MPKSVTGKIITYLADHQAGQALCKGVHYGNAVLPNIPPINLIRERHRLAMAPTAMALVPSVVGF